MEKLRALLNKSNLKVGYPTFHFGKSPEADWKTILLSTVFLTLLIIVFSVYMYIKIDKGEIFASNKSAGTDEVILDVNLLKETVSYYQNKALEFESINKASTPYVDPSP